jgi:hydrogenase maturation protease
MSDGLGQRAPVLVLGLGNMLLQDDGVGLQLLESLRVVHGEDPRVDFVDGGTQGISLLPLLCERHSVLVLDAVQQGAPSGTVHRLDDARARAPRGHAGANGGAHEMNAGDLLAAAELLGDLPARVALVGIEPEHMRTGIGLSPAVRQGLSAATAAAHVALRSLLVAEVSACTN